jgi:hypothetical protein
MMTNKHDDKQLRKVMGTRRKASRQQFLEQGMGKRKRPTIGFNEEFWEGEMGMGVKMRGALIGEYLAYAKNGDLNIGN